MKKTALSLLFVFAFCVSSVIAQTVLAPQDVLGFTPGDDRKLASWSQTVDYYKKLAVASDRVTFHEIGKSTMGKPFIYVTISSPENIKNLKKYKEINDKLADPRLIKSNDKTAKKLIKQGKTIVLKTFGVHSTEVGSYLSSMLIAQELASSDEPRIKKILDQTIILIVPALSPDGVDIVKNWYDKTLGTPYEGTSPPELYHKYVGHDLNRDWYAFTQVESQLTVQHIHNVWRPQIVHDVHQQGSHGARFFVPPYMDPVEPNVPKQIVEGYTELGLYVAKDMRGKGFQGLTTGTTYDAWTPARAYSHYHGGVRILSETASARLATPITVKAEELRGGRGVNPHKDDANNGPAWKGGEWRLGDITNYMTTGAFSLLDHAADNREKWLSRFYEIGKEAVWPRKDGEIKAFVLPPTKTREANRARMILVTFLARAGVQFLMAEPKNIRSATFQNYLGLVLPGVSSKKEFNDLAVVIRMDQPYAGFAKAMLESQSYPNLLSEDGNPIQPYDVTAHSLPWLIGAEVVAISDTVTDFGVAPKYLNLDFEKFDLNQNPINIYHSNIASMDEGWTRWVFEKSNIWAKQSKTSSLNNLDIKRVKYGDQHKSIIFPDQLPNQILNGYPKGSVPDEYTGGVGKEGVENLKKFVEAGGTLVFFNRASNFAIEQFGLPIRDVTKDLSRKDFYIPGSILRTNLNMSSAISKGMPEDSIAWFEHSPVFDIGSSDADSAGAHPNRRFTNAVSVTAGGPLIDVQIVARYPSDPKEILLSGWALGAEKIAGKAALLEVKYGKGKIVLFGFRPQYRGQSLATFPLIFNSIN